MKAGAKPVTKPWPGTQGRTQPNETVYELTSLWPKKKACPCPLERRFLQPNPKAPMMRENERRRRSRRRTEASGMDIALKEVKRIFADLISLSANDQAIAAAGPEEIA